MPRIDPREEGRPGRRPPPKKSALPPLLGVLLLAVLGGGLALAVLSKKEEAAAAQESRDTGKPMPFADLPPDVPPPPRGRGARADGRPFERVPEGGLASEPAWQEAQRLAEEAEALYREAVAAKNASEYAQLNYKGNEAKRRFDEALEMTAEWEESLIERFGETNPQVSAIMRKRSQWFDRVRWLHKSTSR